MSFQPQFPGIFSPASGAQPAVDETPQPATEKQMHYAQSLALKLGKPLPKGLAGDRSALSKWIDSHKSGSHKSGGAEGRFSNYPSSKQVAFAERIARLKRRDVPQECFRDKTLMSRWIDGNKPR